MAGFKSESVAGFKSEWLADLRRNPQCRSRIEHFRQDTILDDLFGLELERHEDQLEELLATKGSESLWGFFCRIESTLLQRPLASIKERLRKDTSTVLHTSGTGKTLGTIEDVVSGRTSFLNAMLLYLLWRAKGFELSFGSLPEIASRYAVPQSNVISRYGPAVTKHLRCLLADFDEHSARLADLEKIRPQKAKRLWELGCFPVPA